MKLLVMQSSPLPCYLIPLRLEYFPQHPILEHPLAYPFIYQSTILKPLAYVSLSI